MSRRSFGVVDYCYVLSIYIELESTREELFLTHIMTSEETSTPPKVAFLGPLGTYSHQVRDLYMCKQGLI